MLSVLRARGLPVALVVGFASFGGWSLLLPVVPLAVSQAGGSDAVAGAVTAVFMAATVLTQLGTPRLLRALGYRSVLAAGCVLLGVPSLVFLASTAAPVALGVSVARGVGFGLVTVAGSALVAELVPRDLLGRATGAQGIASATGQMIGLPAGLALLDAGHADVVYLLGAAVPLLAVVAVGALPPVWPAHSEGPRQRMSPAVLLVPCLAMVVVACVHGGVTGLLPIAVSEQAAVAGVALSVVSGAILVGRYGAGVLVDRFGVGPVMVPGLGLAAGGTALFAVAIASGGAAPLMAGAGLFGIGFGTVQNTAMVALFRSAGPTQVGAASAAWNISFDAGVGAGALALGVIAGVGGFAGAFTVSAVAIVLVIPVVAFASRPLTPAVSAADRVAP